MKTTNIIALSAAITLSMNSYAGTYTDTGTDYTNTETTSTIQFGPFNDAIEQQNFILCVMKESNAAKLYKPGFIKKYTSMSNYNDCDKSYGSYEMWSGKADLERHFIQADGTDIAGKGVEVKVWRDSYNPYSVDIKAKVNVTAAVSTTNPNGLFTMAYEGGEDVDTPTLKSQTSSSTTSDGWNRFQMTTSDDMDGVTTTYHFTSDRKNDGGTDKRRMYVEEKAVNNSNSTTARHEKYAAAVIGNDVSTAKAVGVGANWATAGMCYDKNSSSTKKRNALSELFYKTDTTIDDTTYSAGEKLSHSNKADILLSSDGSTYNIPGKLGRYKLWEHSETDASVGTTSGDFVAVNCPSYSDAAPSDSSCGENKRRMAYDDGGSKDGKIFRVAASKYWVWSANIPTFKPSGAADYKAYKSDYTFKLTGSDTIYQLGFNAYQNLTTLNTSITCSDYSCTGTGDDAPTADSIVLKTTLTDVGSASTDRSESGSYDNITWSTTTKADRFYKYADGVLNLYPNDDQDYLTMNTTNAGTIIPLVNIPQNTVFTQVYLNSGADIPTTSNTGVDEDDSGNPITFVSKPTEEFAYMTKRNDSDCSGDTSLAALLTEAEQLGTQNRTTIAAPGFTWGSKTESEFDKDNFKVEFGVIQSNRLSGW